MTSCDSRSTASSSVDRHCIFFGNGPYEPRIHNTWSVASRRARHLPQPGAGLLAGDQHFLERHGVLRRRRHARCRATAHRATDSVQRPGTRAATPDAHVLDAFTPP